MLKFRRQTEFKESEIGGLKARNTDDHYVVVQGVSGKIPKDWKMRPIKEDYNVNTGERVSPSSEGLIPVYGANGFAGYSENFIIDKEAIITGRVGTLGRVFHLDEKVNVSDNALYVTKKTKEAVPKFLYYAMRLIFEKIEEVLNVGTTQPLLKQSEVKGFSIPFPDYQEQIKIATILSWFDGLIENKSRQNEILEKTAIAIFQSWFIDFEPFKDGKFAESELGKIPEGWYVDYTAKIIVFDPKVDLTQGEIYPFVEMKLISPNVMACEYYLKEYKGSGTKFHGEELASKQL